MSVLYNAELQSTSKPRMIKCSLIFLSFLVARLIASPVAKRCGHSFMTNSSRLSFRSNRHLLQDAGSWPALVLCCSLPVSRR